MNKIKELTDIISVGSKKQEYRLSVELINKIMKEKAEDTTSFILTTKD